MSTPCLLGERRVAPPRRADTRRDRPARRTARRSRRATRRRARSRRVPRGRASGGRRGARPSSARARPRRAARRAARRSSGRSSCRERQRRAGEGLVEVRRAPGARAWIAARCASTVAQSPRAIGPVSSKSFSIVRRISGSSASGGAPAALEEERGGAMERDDVVRREDRARRGRACARSRRARTAAGRASRRASSPGGRASRPSRRSRAAQAPSSCSGPRERVNVCSGWTLKRRSCGSSAASGVAPLTCATHGPGVDRRRHVRDRRVRHAEEHELRIASRRPRARRRRAR